MSSNAPQMPPGFIAGVGKVVVAEWIGPRMRRVKIKAPELAALDCGDSPAPGLRLLIAPDGHPVVMPTPSLEKGLTYPPGTTPPDPRTVTIRGYDASEATIDVDVATTHDGVLTNWASSAAVGDEVGFAGPRLFPALPDGPLVLLGDESTIPAIASIIDGRLEGQPKPAYVGIEIGSSEDEIELGLPVDWLYRQGKDPGVALVDALGTLTLPENATVWVAGESGMARAARAFLQQCSARPAHIRASGYWRSGTSSVELDEAILKLTQDLVSKGESMELLDEFALAFEPNRG